MSVFILNVIIGDVRGTASKGVFLSLSPLTPSQRPTLSSYLSSPPATAKGAVQKELASTRKRLKFVERQLAVFTKSSEYLIADLESHAACGAGRVCLR